jgi:glyoxylase-like metal-dependent hydrolase (beta-lactamase superfamily II)
MGRSAGWICAGWLVWVVGCSSSPTTQERAQDALEAMGGPDAVRGVQSYVMQGGTGTRARLGQIVSTGQPDPPAQLKNVVETYDLAAGRAVLDYELTAASGFTQHRQEILTRRGDRAVGLENVGNRPLAVVSPSGLFSWGSQNSPVMALRRNIVTIVRVAADTSTTEVPQDKELNGRMYAFGNVLFDGETIGIYFDPTSKLVAAIEATDTETMIGDATSVYLYEDYRDVAGVRLPHKITITKAGQPYADVQFTSASLNEAGAMKLFEIPASATSAVDRALAAGADYSPVTLTQIDKGVHFAQAYSHHSLVVEFPSFLAVVEAPYTEAQTKTLTKLLTEQFPMKPIRYAAVTHPHFDHTGGVRGMAAMGATIVAARAHEGQLKDLLETPHTNPPDDLAARRRGAQNTGTLEVFDGKKVITEGTQSLELYTISGSPHVDPMVIAFVPGTGVLFQSDLFFPGTGGGNTPEAAHLLRSVRELRLPVRTNAGGHGGVAKFEELVKAVGTN